MSRCVRFHLAFLAGAVVSVGSVVAILFFGSVFDSMPIAFRARLLFLPVPVFLFGGMIAGWGTGRGWRSMFGFGVGAVLPGYFVPVLMVATQGIGRDFDLFLAVAGIPAACYAVMGAMGGCTLGRGLRAAAWVSAGFAVGALLGPILARLSILVRFSSKFLENFESAARIS